MYHQLLENLTQTTQLITANQRLASYLLNQYDTQQRQQGLKQWPQARITALSTWLEYLWHQQLSDSRIIINDQQVYQLWQNVINCSTMADDIFSTHDVVDTVYQAWKTKILWQLNYDDLEKHSNQDINAFILWSKAFEEALSENHYLCSAQLSTEISTGLNELSTILPNDIILIGFDDLPPAHQRLMDYLKKTTTVDFFKPQNHNNSVQVLALPNADEEIITMARWAKQLLLTKQQTKKPYRIGCVVPELASLRYQIENYFTQVFSQFALIPGIDPANNLPFNISAGRNFDDFTVIKNALLALEVYQQPLNLEHVSKVLLAPYINNSHSCRCCAAIVDKKLRQGSSHLLSTSELLEACSIATQQYPSSQLLQRWQEFFEYADQLKQHHTLSSWADHFQKLLIILGWPGQRSLDSSEFQCVKRWEQLLLELSALDNIVSTLTYQQAVRILCQLAHKTIFQTKSDDKPIQIIGLLEAGGMQFDALWIMGMDNQTWPSPAKPNPFLPHQIQRQYHTPHSCAQRELEFCKTLQQRLIHSAKDVFFSHSQQLKDQPLSPSQLIRPYPRTTLEQLETSEYISLAQQLFTNQQQEIFDDDKAKRLDTTNSKTSHLSYLLQLQSQCPFRAFAVSRLQANPLPDFQLGINPRLRGIILHQVLELVWDKLHTQAILNTISQHDLAAIIDKCIDKTLTACNLNPPFDQVERQRLQLTLTEYIKLEKKRQPFQVIAKELQQKLTIGNIEITLRVDRIDQLDNGKTLIIDYKTGNNNSIKDWLGDRPKKTQLPMYCLAGDKSVAGIAYLQVQAGQSKLIGLYDSQAFTEALTELKTLPEIKSPQTSWSELTTHWQNTLNELGQQLVSGYSAVDPIDKTICQTCDLHSLCRISSI